MWAHSLPSEPGSVTLTFAGGKSVTLRCPDATRLVTKEDTDAGKVGAVSLPKEHADALDIDATGTRYWYHLGVPLIEVT